MGGIRNQQAKEGHTKALFARRSRKHSKCDEGPRSQHHTQLICKPHTRTSTELRKTKDNAKEAGNSRGQARAGFRYVHRSSANHPLPLHSFHAAPAAGRPTPPDHDQRQPLHYYTAYHDNEKKTATITISSSIGIRATATPSPVPSCSPPPTHSPRPPPLPPLHPRPNLMGLHPRRNQPFLLLHLGKHCNLHGLP